MLQFLLVLLTAALPKVDSCVFNTQLQNFAVDSIRGTWYIYQHQPDLAEGIVTLGCKCSRSNITEADPKTTGEIAGIANICNYFTTGGPTVVARGSIQEYSESLSSSGIFKFKLGIETEHYQVLDVTEDGKNILVAVCNNQLGFNSVCLYYLGRDQPQGKNMQPDILARFDKVAIRLGLKNDKALRLDYKNSENCIWK